LKTSFFDFTLVGVPKELSGSDFTLSGQNEKHILILVDWGNDQETLEPFLEKILAAVDLQLKIDTHVLSTTAGKTPGFALLRQKYNIKYVLMFGGSPSQLGLQFVLPRYTPTSLQTCTFLYSDSLKDIYEERQQGGKQKSGALWQCLKSIFK
jgi:hypothetical protein